MLNFIFIILVLGSEILAENLTKEISGRSLDGVKNIEAIDENKWVTTNVKINWNNVLKDQDNAIHLGMVHDLSSWEAPYEMQKNFPYYLSGIDYDGRPIWVAEIGEWKYRLVTDADEIEEATFEKYMAQTAYRIMKDIKERNTPEDPVTQALLILDMQGFDLAKISHIPTISLIVRMLTNFGEVIDLNLYVALVVNTNAAAHALINLVRPVLGKIMVKAQIFGTNKSRWIPHVLQHCPKDQIPQWYGGNSKNFKPIIIYG